MYNILLTDDEQIVIDSIKFIIDKNFAGQVTVHTALSGTEALEIATKENIDIIFMDINMPGLNGLETVSCITKLKPEVVIIILSAFDRFQYAQEAMNLGVFKYITKPVNRNIIIQTIRSAMNSVDNNRGKLNADQELHKKLDLASPLIESDFIYACIFNNDSSFDLSAYLDYFNISGYPCCFCCFEFPNINPETQFKTYQYIRTIIKEAQNCLVSSFMMNRIAVLFPILSQSTEPEPVHELINAIYSTLSFKIGAGIRAGVSSITTDILTLKRSYNEAVMALNKTPANGGIYFTGRNTSIVPETADDTGTYRNQLLMRLRAGDSSSVKSLFELYSAQIIATEKDLNKIKNSFFELIVTARNITCEINPEFQNQAFSDAFSIFSTQTDIASLKEYVSKTLLEYLGVILSVHEHKENPIIKKVCDYIYKNTKSDISLEQMAEYVNVSSFYLSKLFKEDKGVTFINFLNDTRLEKSRELLQNPELSIKEITAEVGYNDQNYFSRIFRNKYGVTPTEFRSGL